VDNPALDLFDGRLRSALIRIINTSLSDTQWLQASLSIKHGGLGIRQVLLVLHAFLASAASTSDLQSQILLASACTADTQFDTYLADWQVAHGPLSPSDPLPVKQSVWTGTNQVFCLPVQPWSRPFLALISSGVASMEQLLPRDCQGPLLQIVQIR